MIEKTKPLKYCENPKFNFGFSQDHYSPL